MRGERMELIFSELLGCLLELFFIVGEAILSALLDSLGREDEVRG
jgi:hypothetical protein